MEEIRSEPTPEETKNDENKEYFFHPVESTEKSAEASEEKETQASSVEMQEMQELLKSISEETTQLNEFLTEENKLINELCISLKNVLKKLHVSFSIPPENIPLQKRAKKIVLNEEGKIIIANEKGEEQPTFLAEYPPEIIMAVLWEVMPELTRAIMTYRKRIVSRVNFFVRLKKELKSLVKTFASEEEASEVEGQKR